MTSGVSTKTRYAGLLATTTERADRTIGACLHVDASIEAIAVWRKISTPAAGAKE
jgi:hypothetical protein